MIEGLSDTEKELYNDSQRFGNQYIRPDAMEYIREKKWPYDIFEKCAEEELIGIQFDEAFGGRGATLAEECIINENFARADSSVGFAITSATAGATAVSQFGTKKQKERYIEPITDGEMIGGIGMTEPDTGSSISDISTTAVREGDDYVIDGEKKWVGNGTVADWIVTLCRTDLEQTDTRQGLSFIIVPTDEPGYTAEPMDKLGLDAADHGRLTYDGVLVPTENLIGNEEGRGFYQALDWLNHGRVTTAATAVGMAQGAFDRALEYAKQREQGGQIIGDYQGMRWKLADMYEKISVSRSQMYRAAHSVEQDSTDAMGTDPISQASIAKLSATEKAQDVAKEAIQVFGGDGYAKEYEVEHFYRDVRSTTLYEGTSEILRNTIGKVLFDELG